MGLSAPLALLFGALVALPIAAHLLRRADVRAVRLPTVALLARAAVESRRRPRLVEPILLAFRVAAFLALALALAAPFVEQDLAFGDGRLASVVLVVDDSMSMSRRAGETSLDALARARAEAIVEALPEGSEVALVGGGSPARVLVPRTSERFLVLDLLRRGEPRAGTARGGDLLGAIALAGRQLAGARFALRRVVVLGDLRGAALGEPDLASGIGLAFERIGGDEEVYDAAVVRASIERRDGALRVSVGVRSFGEGPSTLPISLERGGETLARAEVALTEGSAVALLELPEGTLSGAALDADPTAFVRIDPGPLDGLAADDVRGVLLRPPSAPRVVLVDRSASAPRSRFLEPALRLAPREHGGPIAVRRVEPAALPGLAPATVDVLAVLDVDLREPRLAEAVRAIVADGAGLLIAAGPTAGAGSDVRVRELLPARLTADAGRADGFVRPLGSPLPALDAALAAVRIERRVVLEPDDDAQVLLAFGDGAPAWVASPSRRTAVVACSLDDAWTDWPYRPVFLPVVVRALTLLSRPGAMPDEPAVPGALGPLVVPRGTRAVQVVAPTGAVVELTPAGSPPAAALDRFVDAGAYAVSFVDEAGQLQPAPRAAFVLAPDAGESDPALLPVPEPRGDEGAASSGPSLVRTDLSPWVYLLVGLLALVEGGLRLRRAGEGVAG
jgi:hypothetical protein